MDWTCVGCDADNKPIHTYVIEEKAVEIRCILSVYEEHTVLAFRYTANLKNVWQDLLWAFQVDLLSNLEARRGSTQRMQGPKGNGQHVEHN